MTPQDTQILFRVAQWVSNGNRKVVKTIRQLAETEENYLLIIREIDRVEAQLARARSLGSEATLTLIEWLITLEDFHWQCAYCQSGPFQVMSHVVPLPAGGTITENCVPACYRCSSQSKKNKQSYMHVQVYLANKKKRREGLKTQHNSPSLLSFIES